jgi:hypothetical protein
VPLELSRLFIEDILSDKKSKDGAAEMKQTLITENEEVKEGEARPIPKEKMYYYSGLSRMTNGFVQE